jgi:hypothetical protein
LSGEPAGIRIPPCRWIKLCGAALHRGSDRHHGYYDLVSMTLHTAKAAPPRDDVTALPISQ